MAEDRIAKKNKKKAEKFQKMLIGEYKEIRILSTSGGFSIVLEGINIRLGRSEAIKAINCDTLGKSGLSMENVEQEINLLAKLNHHNIVKIHNLIRRTTEDYDYMFVVMELCGGTLMDIIKEHPEGVPRAQALNVLKQLVDGVFYLHSQGIIHRDLKPENVFMEGGVVKIGDFNISKEVGVGTTTTPSQVMLTYAYSPPERAVFGEKGDFRIDLWAIGVIYYILLQGEMPFTGDSHKELLDNIGRVVYPPLSKGEQFDTQVIQMTLVLEKDRININQLREFIMDHALSPKPEPKVPPMEEFKTQVCVPKRPVNPPVTPIPPVNPPVTLTLTPAPTPPAPNPQSPSSLSASFIPHLKNGLTGTLRMYDLPNSTPRELTINLHGGFPYESATCALGTHIYIAGNFSEDECAGYLYVLNCSTGELTQLASMLERRSHFPLIALSTRELFAGGGWDYPEKYGNYYLDKCERYCIYTNKWEGLPGLNVGRRYHTACYFPDGQAVYIFGGVVGPSGDTTDSIESLNLGVLGEKWRHVQLKVKSGWKPALHIQSRIISHTEILIFGKVNRIFDVHTLSMKTIQKPPNTTGYFFNSQVSNVLYKGKIYCFNDTKEDEIIQYDIQNRKWGEVINC